MTIEELFAKLRGFDGSLAQQIVPLSEIIPKGGKRIQIASEELFWSPAAAKQVRQKLGISEELERPLPSEVTREVWKALIAFESRQSENLRRLPSDLKVTTQEGEVVGFADAGLVTLSNTQIIEAIEAPLEELRVQLAEVTFVGQENAASWHLKMIFPSEEIIVREGDIVQGGLSIRHSAAGLHAIQVRTELRRLVCLNGSSVPICLGDKQLRIRRCRDEQFADQQVIDKVRLLVTQGIRELDDKLKAVKGLAEKKVDARAMLRQIALTNRLRATVAERLQAALEEDEAGSINEKAMTRYDVWNAVTRIATHNPNGILRDSVRKRLSVYSGCFSQEGVHRCPTCNRILEPSSN